MRCTVKSENERNPYPMFYMSWETARFKWEEGGDDVKSAWSLHLGRHTCYNGPDSEGRPCEGERISKPVLSSDWSLQLDFMKVESLVIADQNAAVNTFPGLVHTARHTKRVGNTRSAFFRS